MNNKNRFVLCILMLISALGFHPAALTSNDKAMTAEELERWFNSDEEVVDPIRLINEGELVFLKQQPPTPPHEAHHVITILPNSIDDGWVGLAQCHDNLDIMPAAQIVFTDKKVRRLRIVSSANIEQARVDGDTVQLKKIAGNARICIELETRALWRNLDGSLSLRTGPYQRRFLDGYFPMQLLLEIRDPHNRLRYRSITPKVQTGLTVEQSADTTRIRALFEGLLHLVVNFSTTRTDTR